MSLLRNVPLLILVIALVGSEPLPRLLFDLNVVHINDFHARFEETNEAAGSCKSDDCIGGFSRMYTTIQNALTPDSILLNAGDNFQGTLWYNLFKWNVTKYFLNKLPFDAIVLGNHEFDDGIKGVVPFIKNLDAPVVVSNIDDSLEPEIQGTYNKSVVVVRRGRKIGIIGVITRLCAQISNTESLRFTSESEAVNAEAERLVREEGVFTNIVLSHSGYDVEREIAQKATTASKIGLVVGGHSHTFLFTGEPAPGPDNVKGPYPTIETREEDGKKVLVVQASAYCKYVGNINVNYDDNGDYYDHSGAPIYLSHDVPHDEAIDAELQPWKLGVDEQGTRIIGSSLVKLDRSMCKQTECTLGNFVADTMVYSYLDLAHEGAWTNASLAVFNAGGLRTEIEEGNITYSDMMTAQPFGNTFDVGEIEGKHIKEMFEFSMSSPYSFGRAYIDINLLQVSGFQLLFDVTKPIGQRVISIKVRCLECTVPVYEDFDINKTYRLIVPSFLKTGGDGFQMIADNLKNIRVGRVDIDVFVDYLAERSPIFEEIEGRIVIIGQELINARNMEF